MFLYLYYTVSCVRACVRVCPRAST